MGLPFREGIVRFARTTGAVNVPRRAASRVDERTEKFVRYVSITVSPLAEQPSFVAARAQMARYARFAVLLLVAAAFDGCATMACQPMPIVVAKKDERVRLDTRPGLPRTSPSGRLDEEVRPTLVREFWVQSDDGNWHRISEQQYRATAIGDSMEICR